MMTDSNPSPATSDECSSSPSIDPSPPSSFIPKTYSEIHSSLLQLGQSEAREEIMKKAMMMLGLSEELKGTERGDALKADADCLLSFANEMKSTEQASIAMEEASKLMSLLSNKYGDKSSKLYSNMWETYYSMSDTEEGRALYNESASILNGWANYGKSDDGKKLLESLQKRLSEHAKESGKYVLDLYDSVKGKNGAVDKEKLTVATTAAGKVLAEDEDVKSLIEEGKKQFGIITADDSQSAIDPSLMLDKADDQLKKLKETELGRQLLAKGAEVLKANSDKLTPEQLLSQSQTMISDAEARQKFVDHCKDLALDFLLGYLPSVSVPAVTGNKEGTDYTFDGIDLSQFKVKKEDVRVVISEKGVHIHAINISCVMKNLKFSYRRNALIKGSGLMDAVAEQSTFDLQLEVEAVVPPQVPKRPTARKPSTNNTAPPPSNENKINEEKKNEASSEQSLSAADAYLAMLSDNNHQQEEKNDKHNDAAPPSATPSSTIASSSLPLTDSSSVSNDSASPSDPSIIDSSSSPPPSHLDGGGKVEIASSLLSNVSDAFIKTHRTAVTPNLHLKISSVQIKVPHFKLQVIGEKVSTSIYNFFLKIFSSQIRDYVEKVLNQEVIKHSDTMIKTINGIAHQYLPIIFRITRKAEKLIEKSTKAATDALNEKKANNATTTTNK